MKVYVNDREVTVAEGMTVEHALVRAGLVDEIRAGKRTYDEFGNEIGMGGALTEGARIYVR